jgi:hypothetical protein
MQSDLWSFGHTYQWGDCTIAGHFKQQCPGAALVVSEDNFRAQPRRQAIINALARLPENVQVTPQLYLAARG